MPLVPNAPQLEPLPVAPSRRLAAQVARLLWRRWLLAALLGLCGAWTTAFLVWTLYPTQNTAEVWLLVKRSPHEADRNDASTALLVKNPVVLEAAVRQRGLKELLRERPQPQPLDWLDQRLSTGTGPDQSIVRIVAVSTRADEPAQVFAEDVAAAYVQESEHRQKVRLTQLQETYQQAQESLRTQRAALAAQEDPRRAQLDTDRQQLRLERSRLQAELRVLQSQDKSPAPPGEAEVAEALKTDPAVRDLEKELNRLTTQLKDYERISARGPNDPALAKMTTQLEATRTLLAHRRLEVVATLERQAAARAREELQQSRAAVETKLAGLDDVEKRLTAEAQALPQQGDEVTIQALKEDVEVKQESARRLNAEIQALKADAKTGPSAIQLGETRVYADANRGQRLTVTALAATAVFLLLALFVGLIEMGDRRVKAASDLGRIAEMTLLGTLPNLNAPPSTSDAESPGPLAEAVDVLRTLLLRRTGGGPCVFMVTSASEREGKTALASHLAASLARAWRKTLFIDGDLRRPGAHKLFQALAEPGLSDVLRGDVEAMDVVQPTPLSRLWLLSAGRADSHALQALAQPDSASFLESLREQYEYIVVDSSAVLPVADTLLLSQHVDVVILAVRCGSSEVPSVRAAQQRLDDMGAPLFGAVVLGSA